MLRSLMSGVAGLKSYQTKMDVIGNNIANVNTVGFKSSSVNFADVFYQTTQSATSSSTFTQKAGTNAKQIGYGSTDTVSEETDIHYKTSAPYFRIGAGYNVFHKKPYLPGKLLVGARLGFSSFSYDVEAPAMNDPVWGGNAIPISYEGVKSNAAWLELVAEVRTNVYKNFHLGFSIRYKSLFCAKKSENSEPWYITGYGKNKSSGFGITYNISYLLPF